MTTNLLILGASARAAAFSALRAGFNPWCIDLFADSDLRARCPARRLRGRYPNAFLDEIHDAPPGPWMYTGALENHGFLISQLADRRPLWGNDAAALIQARDPAVLASHAAAAGLPVPKLGSWPPGPGSWLVKPRAGASGLGVRFWGHEITHGNPGNLYVQEYIDGSPASAVFCATAIDVILLGATRQLVGTPWLNAGAFRYAGSVGPMPLDGEMQAGLEKLGQRLGRLGLRGLFGIDGIIAGGMFWPIEVNPRYTASVEVLELASGLRALEHHARAFARKPVPPPPVPPPSKAVGKAILYAPHDGMFPASGPWEDAADIPEPGAPLQSGHPVLTLLAEGADEEECMKALRRRAEEVEKRLWPGPRSQDEGIRPVTGGQFTP